MTRNNKRSSKRMTKSHKRRSNKSHKGGSPCLMATYANLNMATAEQCNNKTKEDAFRKDYANWVKDKGCQDESIRNQIKPIVMKCNEKMTPGLYGKLELPGSVVVNPTYGNKYLHINGGSRNKVSKRKVSKRKVSKRKVSKRKVSKRKSKSSIKMRGGNPFKTIPELQTALNNAKTYDDLLIALNDPDTRKLITSDKTKQMDDMYITDAIREINRLKQPGSNPLTANIPNVLNLRTIVSRITPMVPAPNKPYLPPQAGEVEGDLVNLTNPRGSRVLAPPLPAKKS